MERPSEEVGQSEVGALFLPCRNRWFLMVKSYLACFFKCLLILCLRAIFYNRILFIKLFLNLCLKTSFYTSKNPLCLGSKCSLFKHQCYKIPSMQRMS